jgi:uncharacterized circularly permuted ATP-grasp superfamily protein
LGYYFATLEAVGWMNWSEIKKSSINSRKMELLIMFMIRKRISSAMEIRSHSFVIHQSEWTTIEKGLIQRANLLDLIYKDIYGEQLIKIILFQRN